MQIDAEGRPKFAPASTTSLVHRMETRKVPIPPHRMTPLKSAWAKIYPPIVDNLKLQVRMNVKSKAVELRTSKHTIDSGALQKAEDFVKAFSLVSAVLSSYLRAHHHSNVSLFTIADQS